MRINLFAAPSAGKSTLAAKIFSQMKIESFNVELVREYIKNWAYQNRSPKSYDQVYIFGKQLQSEDILFQNSVEHIVTDSPLLMQVFYAKMNNFPCWKSLLEIAQEFEKEQSSINILLRRNHNFQNHGRFHGESQADTIHEQMKEFLVETNTAFRGFNSDEFEPIYQFICSSVQ